MKGLLGHAGSACIGVGGAVQSLGGAVVQLGWVLRGVSAVVPVPVPCRSNGDLDAELAQQ